MKKQVYLLGFVFQIKELKSILPRSKQLKIGLHLVIFLKYEASMD